VVPGAEHQVRPVHDTTEHRELLRIKVLEEAGEVAFAGTDAEVVKELADLLSVMQAVAAVRGVEWRRVQDEQFKRDTQGGGFLVGLVWETSR
jgi:phosphoribosyl-ATP pyrophosphohydrolase